MPSHPDFRPHVLVVGAGFAGLYAARALAASDALRITVIDRKNHHTFQPLLYQVATAGLSPGQIATPIRRILRNRNNVEVLLGEVTGFDLSTRRVRTRDYAEGGSDLGYDYLVIAAGARHAYFGHDDWERFAPGLKTIEDALDIRRRVLLAFEEAERRAAAGHAPLTLDFYIVGGGPTGVELAGALADIARNALTQEFRYIDPRRASVVLVEAGPRILPSYPEDLSRSAMQQLQELGVDVRTGTAVTGIAADSISIGTETRPSALTLWAAGVKASPLGAMLGAAVDRAGRVLVQSDCSLPGHPEVFVIGDLAALNDAHGHPLPGIAPVAIQQGQFVGKLIRQLVTGTGVGEAGSPAPAVPRPAFHYRDKGSLATIGRAAAVADFGKLRISGFIAWLAWLFIHILYLVGFRNRLLVLIEWAWAYMTYERSTRLITGELEGDVSRPDKTK